MKTNRLFIACVATLALAACGDTTELTTTLSGAAEKPTAVTSTGSGTATVTIDGDSLEVSGSFKDLQGTANAAHIHGPIKADGTGDIFCDLSVDAGLSGTIGGGTGANACSSKTLSDANVEDFKAGKFYINIHTSSFGAGEIRGDLKPKE
ncbi:MAG: CHRD domain-containing protein [Myxococcaceae bacterium]|nr:CHRD domain-containing protein [Myxococcaceae bacterium]